MPLRLPSRRRSGPQRDPSFRRRSPPTPQATRLMKVSLLSGVALLVILAVLFVPKALEVNVQPPVVTMTWRENATAFTVEVVRVSVRYPLATYRGELNVTDPTVPDKAFVLLHGTPQDGGNLTFVDVDGDGALTAGDTFTVRKLPGSWTYVLFLFHETRDVGAGPPCPCAVGLVRFPT